MRNLAHIKLVWVVIFALFSSASSNAQEGTVTIEQDKKIDVLLKERKKLFNKGELKAHYAIQVFSGEIASARSTIKKCKSKFSEYKSEIIYETPNYKVWVGKYRNKIDAERALLKISKAYPDAFVFKPEGKEKK